MLASRLVAWVMKVVHKELQKESFHRRVPEEQPMAMVLMTMVMIKLVSHETDHDDWVWMIMRVMMLMVWVCR